MELCHKDSPYVENIERDIMCWLKMGRRFKSDWWNSVVSCSDWNDSEFRKNNREKANFVFKTNAKCVIYWDFKPLKQTQDDSTLPPMEEEREALPWLEKLAMLLVFVVLWINMCIWDHAKLQPIPKTVLSLPSLIRLERKHTDHNVSHHESQHTHKYIKKEYWHKRTSAQPLSKTESTPKNQNTSNTTKGESETICVFKGPNAKCKAALLLMRRNISASPHSKSQQWMKKGGGKGRGVPNAESSP